ncbi:MAG: hypothetical protein NTX11_00025 [Candidatus Saccharibacteria bacterium]|nr:hypothetical protein [Candidatus Saccharibacteria bacterium]
MGRDPLRSLTRGISEAVEHDPAFIAMTEGNGVIPMSWGNLGSQLMELEIVGPSVEAVCDFLSIDSEELRDPEIVISHQGHIVTFRQRLTDKYEQRYRAEHGPFAQLDTQHFLAVRETWKVDDSKERAESLVVGLREEARAIEQLNDQEEYRSRRRALDFRALEYSALKSGYALSAADLVREALSFDGLQYFTQADIVKAISSTLDEIIYKNHLMDSDVLLKDVTIGDNEVGIFLQMLRHTFSGRMREGVDAQWKPIGALLMPGSIYKHPLLAGNEK